MPLLYFPDPIFKKKAEIVTAFDDTLKHNIDIMFHILREHEAIGLGANMCGILQRIIIAPIAENEFVAMINPEIIHKSEQTQIYEEASLSLPGISAKVTRPATITVTYQDIDQNRHEFTATDFISTVIQHEIDYLDGITYLEHLSKAKAKMLRDKMRGYMKKMDRKYEKAKDKKGCGCC